MAHDESIDLLAFLACRRIAQHWVVSRPEAAVLHLMDRLRRDDVNVAFIYRLDFLLAQDDFMDSLFLNQSEELGLLKIMI